MKCCSPIAVRAFYALLVAMGLVSVVTAIAAPGAQALRVGVAPVSPPMIFRDGKAMAGVEADLARALGRDLGREIQFVEVSWEDLIDALNERKIDIIMSSMSITRARQFRMTFTDPYLRISQTALVRSDQMYRFGPFSTALASGNIGVKRGTTGDLLVQQEFPKAKRKYYKSGEQAAKALKKGTIDLFIDDSTMIWYLAGLYEAEGLAASPMTLSDEVLAWGINRSDADLLAAVNGALKKLKANGELDKILLRWIPKLR